jgi:hypothetical protein
MTRRTVASFLIAAAVAGCSGTAPRHKPGTAHDRAPVPPARAIARTGRPTHATPRPRFAGPPPQHLVFAGGSAYITSGYGSQIERVSITSGRVLTRVPAPYGSVDLNAAGAYVVTTSLFRGTLAIYDRALHLLRVRRVAPSAEDVALTTP